jgi:hypothetical protein
MNANLSDQIYVTLTGLPLTFRFEWPFHKSTSGADFSVLHGDIVLENSGGLHAPVAVNMSATVREVMPSLERHDAEGPVINTLRKEVDRRQIEFLKSGKMVPVQFSSRHYDFKRDRWVFGKAGDAEIETLLAAKIFWQSQLKAGAAWMGDPTEALYVESSTAHLLEIAQRLRAQGLIEMQNEQARATKALLDRREKFEADMRSARDELEKKHAFERG